MTIAFITQTEYFSFFQRGEQKNYKMNEMKLIYLKTVHDISLLTYN